MDASALAQAAVRFAVPARGVNNAVCGITLKYPGREHRPATGALHMSAEEADIPETHFDERDLRRRLCDDDTLLSETMQLFLDGVQGSRVAKLRDALAQNDMERLRKEAHSLRGVALTISAPRLAALCATLEARARRGDAGGLCELTGDIEAEHACVYQLITRHAAGIA